MENSRNTKGGVEENTMAILDSSGVKDSRDINDDKLSFLEAVRAASLLSDSSTVPTWKMYDAVFQIFTSDEAALELVMDSYQLLTELDQRYPRVRLAGIGEVAVIKEAWSPFMIGLEHATNEDEGTARNCPYLVDASKFSLLLEEIAEEVGEVNSQLSMKPLRRMALIQYLVSVLEGDFLPRQTVYKETLNWVLWRESLLNMLLGSRRINFKNFIRNCMLILNKRCCLHTGLDLYGLKCTEKSSEKAGHEYDNALVIALSELEMKTCAVVKKLLTLAMELDVIKKEADMQGFTSRADAVRTPTLDIIEDELSYDGDSFSLFLLVFSDPKWKLEIILQYFSKYYSKPSVRTRNSSKSDDNATLDGLLSYFSNITNMKSIIRRINVEVVQLFLAHAFQAYISLHVGLKHVGTDDGKLENSSLLQICEGIVSAFQNMRKIDEDLELVPFGKEALFTAATILSTKS